MPYPDYTLARGHKFERYTAGNQTLNSTVWANLPTIGTTKDLVLEAEVGDVLIVEMNGLWNNEALDAYLDFVSILSGSPVNSWSKDGAPDNAAQGVPSWTGRTSQYSMIAGSWRRAVVAGDISPAGQVTLRLRYRTNTATNKILISDANVPLQFAAWNIGPVDPY